MAPQAAAHRSRHLTAEGLGAFLHWLSTDQALAGTQYLDVRRLLVKYFTRKGCAHADDLTDLTIDRVGSILHQEPEKHQGISFCYTVARYIWLESLRESVPDRLDDENLPQTVRVEDGFSEDDFRCLDACLQELTLPDRELITEYHRFQGREKIELRKRMAEAHGGSNRLRIITCRIRSRLHACINGCVERSALNSTPQGRI
jgi:DNA-directed RNA polymerase specialized sigma24 family protein